MEAYLFETEEGKVEHKERERERDRKANKSRDPADIFILCKSCLRPDRS